MKIVLSKSTKSLFAIVLVCCAVSFSCKKTLDKDPETFLVSSQVYRNVFDADAAVIGVYGKLMGLAGQYVILNELRGDLMQVTDNADQYLREINTQSTTENNPYANPKPFYSLINDCNDVLKNFDIMLRDNKFKISEYQQRYSDIGCIRAWLYLQLGIHYGTVPYVTDALENIDAVRDQSKYPLLPFNQLLDSLITFTDALPYKLPYAPGTSLVTFIDGTQTQRFFIEKNGLLGDLNLWRGKYTAAATYYRALMESTGYFLGAGTEAFYNNFKVRYADVVANNDLSVGYIRFKESDINSIVDNNSQGWRSMFARGQDAIWNWEMMWVLPFNASFAPVNPFIDLFSNTGGKYLVKPSQQAIINWNTQLQANGFPYDARGGMTWRNINGQPVIMKYLYNYVNETSYLPISPLLKNGQWFLNRAAAVHLHFAEAANRDGRTKLAYAFVNNGISATFDTSTAAGRDVTNLQNTLNYPAPYNFDARNGEFPRYRSDWYRANGIRNRARLVNTPRSDTLSTINMENSIINEAGLELAYEGYRWPDLLRIALRRDDPSFIANKVFDKLQKDGNPAAATVRAKLMRKEYYLPFKWN
ncbi:MAG: RagB/SusD family nutrient uptake outer membrane protein [Pedobacter sp.]|nr:RagB/SusD family nutrient uptake outer membrane protein [Chitinophagaceae bacterium]